MMRLPTFQYRAPKSVREAVKILAGEGPAAQVVAGGTDLYPNMKRRQVEPGTVVGLRELRGLRGQRWRGGTFRIGPLETLRALERDARVRKNLKGLHEAVASISTPILRNMGTIGGNVCLDTRCFYLNQNFEWRRAIHHCLKCGGDTCWTAPGGDKCWAVNSSDTVPVLIALGATFKLVGPQGPREITAEEMFGVTDGREWLGKKPDEILTDILIPRQGKSRSTYVKVRRREAFDFPVLGVAARIEGNGKVERADLVLNAVGPAPVRCREAEEALVGRPLTDEVIDEAAELAAAGGAKPLDNTDFAPSYRKKMIRVHVRRALLAVRGEAPVRQ
ncbi:MAG: FAD binding domain-containing protein [Planctomycetes bacterium]|nr:FAD binding domain-containing protein [Planctomycetota bacterium]